MIGALLLLALASPAYVSEECAFRFEVPAGWEVAPRDLWIEPYCAVVLRPVGKKRVAARLDVDAVIVATTSARFDDAAWTVNLLRIEDGGPWKLLGRGPAPPATTVRSERWNGLRGSSDLGCDEHRSTLDSIVEIFTFTGPAPECELRPDDVECMTNRREAAERDLGAVLATKPEVADEQKRWLAERVQKCGVLRDEVDRDRCVEMRTMFRIEDLKTR